MSDEASVLKIKRRRNFLSRQMKVSTVKEKLRNASLSKFAWKIRAAAYSPVKKFQILRDKLAWLEVVDWRIQKHRSSFKTKRWFRFFYRSTPTSFGTKFENVNDLKMEHIHCEIAYIDFTRFFMNSKVPIHAVSSYKERW